MRCHRVMPVLAAAVALTLTAACDNTRAGARQDTELAAEQAARTSEQAAEATSDAISEAGDATKRAGEAVAEGAADMADKAATAAEAATITATVKSALMADASVDSSHVNVDTDAASRVVTLRGSVPNDIQRAAAERLARDKAPGYRVVNELRIAGV